MIGALLYVFAALLAAAAAAVALGPPKPPPEDGPPLCPRCDRELHDNAPGCRNSPGRRAP